MAPGHRLRIAAARAAVDGAERTCTVVIDGGTITEVLPGIDPDADLLLGDDVVLLPGAVDSHVHLNEPGRTEWEGFASGTVAAARGGVTTVVDMPLNSVPPTTDPAALAAKRAAAAGQLAVDIGFWGGAIPQNLGRLAALADAGALGFKCFLSPSGVDEFPALTPRQFTEAATEIAAFDGLLLVHAEDPVVLDAAPRRSSPAYRDFLASRPDEAEVRAVRRVVDVCRDTGVRTHLLHLSSARAMPLIAAARAEGLPLTVETCPHYLCFDAAAIDAGAVEFLCCPPIRDRGNRAALWEALAEDLIDLVVTDHSPSSPELKTAGRSDLLLAWGGIAGLQVGYSAVLAAAAGRGHPPAWVAERMATRPAALAGLPTKGAIAAGRDADLVVYEPGRPRRVRAEDLAHRHPISAWEGHELEGAIGTVWLRGVPVDGTSRTGREVAR